MGIRGLTTYIAERSDLYLLPYKLQDTFLVIDGNSIASQLYKRCTKCDSAFGGDYDEYYKIVFDFFKSVKKCNITPIVIFDGGYEKKKLQTVYTRNLTKFVILKNSVQNSFSKFKFFPIFMKQTFWDVIEDLDIKFAQCDFEADNEIAAIARHLKCPVLSYDSDFFLYDVLYVPFSSLRLEIIEDKENKKCYMDCLIYDVTIFLKEFEGLDKRLLPLIATLLGNDYIESKTCVQFFNHVIMPKKKNMTFTQRKIHGVLNWLKKESVETAIIGILKHIKKKDGKSVILAINKSIQDYTISSRTLSLFFKTSSINAVAGMNDMNYDEEEDKRLSGLPEYFINLFHQCRILPFLMDMATLHIYFTPLQVEDMDEPSAHYSSFPIIQAIYTIISAYKNQKQFLKIYLKANNRFTILHLEKEIDYFNSVNILDLYEKPSKIKMSIIFNILNLSDNDSKIVNVFDNEWKIFIMTLIYWTKVTNLVTSQIQSILFCAISNFIVQKKVGYFRSSKSFSSKNGCLLNNLGKKEKEENVVDASDLNFSKLIAAVTELDSLKLAQKLLPFRRTNEDSISNFSISKIHPFSVFQSLLYHLIQLNSVLNYPLSRIKVCEFYSGTLVFNLFVNCKKKQNTIEQLVADLPSVQNVYNYLTDILFCYFPTNPKKIKRKQKKKKKKIVVEENNSENSHEEIEDSDYEDESNPYYFLRNTVS